MRLEDLETEELRFLRKICRKLRELEEALPDEFDRDELGLDPEYDDDDLVEE